MKKVHESKPNNGMMAFSDAYRELLEGKKIRRREWETFMHLRIKDGEVLTYKGEYSNFDSDASILISKGWIVIGSKVERPGLDFIDALEELKARKSLTRIDWIDEGKEQFIFIDDGKIVLCREIEFDFMPTYKCLCSQDWEIMS